MQIAPLQPLLPLQPDLQDPKVRVAYCPEADPDTIYVDPRTPADGAVLLVALFADCTADEARQMLIAAYHSPDYRRGPMEPARDPGPPRPAQIPIPRRAS